MTCILVLYVLCISCCRSCSQHQTRVLIILVLLIAFLLVCLLGGFSKVYVSMCDFYGQPHLEEVVWVCTLLVITEVSNQNCVCSEGHLRDGLFVCQKHLLKTPV